MNTLIKLSALISLMALTVYLTKAIITPPNGSGTSPRPTTDAPAHTFRVSNDSNDIITFENCEVVMPTTFEDLLDAIEWVESRGRADAVGDGGNAVGSFQIWKIYVDDVNRIMALRNWPERFTYEDRLNKTKSRRIVTLYLQYYGKSVQVLSELEYFECVARIHNGGPTGHKKECTKAYWENIKARLEVVK